MNKRILKTISILGSVMALIITAKQLPVKAIYLQPQHAYV